MVGSVVGMVDAVGTCPLYGTHDAEKEMSSSAMSPA